MLWSGQVFIRAGIIHLRHQTIDGHAELQHERNHLKDIDQQGFDRLELTAFLRKMAELEKENGQFSEQETHFWSEPDNLQHLTLTLWNLIHSKPIG